jgi:hypothetical protein
MSNRPPPAKPLWAVHAVILVLGTYWAQRPAFHRPRLHTAAHLAEAKITMTRRFRWSEALICGFSAWGGWDSNPGPADYESAALTG